MPTKLAVQTSILSRRWRYSWTFVTNLHFEDLHPNFVCNLTMSMMTLVYDLKNFEIGDNDPIDISTSDNFPNFVDWVLESCKSPKIQLFRLHLLHSYASYERLSNWIDKAVRMGICDLDIEALIVELPLNLLTCKTLTNLRLDHCSPSNYSLWEPLFQPVNLPYVKTLDIVVFSNPFVNAFKLINGCPILENLSLEVKWRSDEDDYIFNLPTLKRLKVTEGCATVMNKVVLHVPNLEYLFVGGQLYSHYVMEDVSSLVEASLSFDDMTMDDMGELLKGLNGVKSLSAAQDSSFMNFKKPVSSPLPIYPNLELLDLKGFSLGLVSLFLESSPHLQHLCIEKAGRSWKEPEFVPSCMLTDLATIKFSHCNGDKTDMEFLQYMLRNAEVLNTVTIIWKNLCTEEEVRFAAEVLNFSKASSHCEIYFL